VSEARGSKGLLAAQIIGGIVIMVAFCGGLFWMAGDFGWVVGWAYLGLLIVGETVRSLLVAAKDPEVMKRRGRAGDGTRGWDKAMLSLFGLGYLAEIVVAAFDARHGWSSPPLWTWGLGAALYVAATALLTWAMRTNTHFEKTVRIQADRDHKVIEDGPYRFVRHPGYVGAIVGLIGATPLMLASWWAFVPAAVATAFMVVRTALEDRMLQAELDGYAAFTKKTRYRLLPGVW
jgi:protein-S-isoprenylcysteine O-methyltransferase Ste14